MSRPLSYGQQTIDDSDVEAVTECLRSGWLTQGPAVRRFEQMLCETVGARHAVACANGTAALHLAVAAMDISGGDLGLTSPITFAATANCLRFARADVGLVDVEPTTGLLDVDRLDERVSQLLESGRPPKVILPVDLAGQPADLPAIRRVADRCGAYVLEDAAHSLGATYEHEGQTQYVGDCAHADAAIFSFHPVKPITTAEGGAVLTNDDALYDRMCALRTHGIRKDPAGSARSEDSPFVGPWYMEQTELGFNYRLSDLQSALGEAQLQRLWTFLERRRQVAAKYDEALARAPLSEKLRSLQREPNRGHAHHLYVIQVRPTDREPVAETARRRKALFEHLHSRGIRAQVHYIPVHWHPYYQEHLGLKEDAFPGALSYYASSLSLPIYPNLTDSDQDRVIAALREWAETG